MSVGTLLDDDVEHRSVEERRSLVAQHDAELLDLKGLGHADRHPQVENAGVVHLQQQTRPRGEPRGEGGKRRGAGQVREQRGH